MLGPDQLSCTSTNSTEYLPPLTSNKYWVTLSTKAKDTREESRITYFLSPLRIEPKTSWFSTTSLTTRSHPWELLAWSFSVQAKTYTATNISHSYIPSLILSLNFKDSNITFCIVNCNICTTINSTGKNYDYLFM
uniref:Putative ovule protein n=1 Tax=Solanum chacoense TaxID=4108 RepID=A0A0V0HDJ9_SOLCH